ncbi:MAG: UxaA family hydrolase [Chitinophagaceae bacterium]|nr:UxaA family hydrolase [Chitinophagaceae bacterium]
MNDHTEEKSVHRNLPSPHNHILKTFKGYRRSDGRVGTANYWLFIPTVFCENRNLDVIKEALRTELGYTSSRQYSLFTRQLLEAYRQSEPVETASFNPVDETNPGRIFHNVDGVKFLNHSGGCGGTRQDSALLSSLLAAYADHPNVGGVTILSLGCQHLQIENLLTDLKKRNPGFDKPLYIFEQQQIRSEEELIATAIRQTFSGLTEINQQERELFPLSQLSVGIVADQGMADTSSLAPSVGYAAGLFVTMGCKVLLRSSRKISFRKTPAQAVHGKSKPDSHLQESAVLEHQQEAVQTISSYDDVGSVKSSGSASSAIADMLDYSSPARLPGLSLVGPSASTAEAITGIVASGATIVLFQTNNTYPTGNPLAPVITISTNPANVDQPDSINDFDVSPVEAEDKTVVTDGEKIFRFCIDVATANTIPKAVQFMYEDFIPIRTGVSL